MTFLPVVMGARGWNQDGSGGEIDVFWHRWPNGYDKTIVLLKPSKFSYWLFNTFSGWCWKRIRWEAPAKDVVGLSDIPEKIPEKIGLPIRTVSFDDDDL